MAETAEQRIQRLVQEVLSGQRTMESVRQSVDRLAGREPGNYSGVDDSAWLGDPARLAQRITSIFANRGVPVATASQGTSPYNETPEQRVARIVQEVRSGQRTLADVRASIDRLAGAPVGDYSGIDDSAWMGDDAKLAERITSIFANRGVPLSVTPPSVPPVARPVLPDGPMPAQPGPPAGLPPVAQPDVPVLDREAEQQAQRDRDAYARLNATLNEYGLGTLGQSVQRWLIEGLSEAEIVQRMRDTDEFRTRFPAIEARKKAGLPAISPGEYVAYERNAAQVMRAAGLPPGFYDSPEDFTRFITNDLSLSELGGRVTLAANAAFNAPQEVRDALAQWGVGPGELTAYWLDPDKAQPLLERRYAAAQLAGTAQRTNYGSLTEDTASRLASVGVSDEQAQQGFGQLVERKELFQSLDRTEDTIDQGAQLGAMFEGNSAARRRIEQRARKRAATFEGRGGFASSQQGLVGLGDAQ